MRKQTIRIWTRLILSLGFVCVGFSEVSYAKEQSKTTGDTLLVQARLGQKVAQRELGKQYFKGQARARDLQAAFYWLKLAADQGDADAQNFIGFMHDTGQGVVENKAEAVRWYQRAAYQQDAQAQYNLGSLYQAGEGLTQSDILAASWYKLAAQKGHRDAQLQIARFFHAGQGVEKDLEQALYWYQAAAAQGDTVAQAQAQRIAAYLQPPAKVTKASLNTYQNTLRQGQLSPLKTVLQTDLNAILKADPSLAQAPVWANLQQDLKSGTERALSIAEINRLGSELEQLIQLANRAARIQSSPLFKDVAALVFYNQAAYAEFSLLQGTHLTILHHNYEQTAMNDISMEALKPLFTPDNQSDFQMVRQYIKQKQSQLSGKDLNKQALKTFLIDAPQYIPAPRFEKRYLEIEASYRHLAQLQALVK